MSGLLTASSRLSSRARIWIVLFLAVPQLYLLPKGSSDLALSTVATAVLAPGVLVVTAGTRDRRLFRVRLLQVLLGLLAVRLLALTWSPEPRSGAQSVVLLGQFIVVVLIMTVAVWEDRDALRHLQRVYWPWVVLEGCLVIIFRVLPDVEHTFLRSIAGPFVGQNTLAGLFAEHPNNVLDVVKSGGVFTNANVAAMFLGVNGLAALAISSVTGTRWVRNVAIFTLASVPFTGSKAGTILTFALPVAAIAIYRMKRMATPVIRRYALVATVALPTLGAVLIGTVNLGAFKEIREAFVGRTLIWRFAADAFLDSPVLGLGYGGWELGFASYAARTDLYRSFPPHNIFLATWSRTGIVGLAITVIFFALAARLVLRGTRSCADQDVKFAIYTGAAFAWVLIQGMGENTDIFGEIHLIPILALLTGYFNVHFGEEMKKGAAPAHSRNRKAPVIPALGDVHRGPGHGSAPFQAAVRGQGCASEVDTRGRLG